MLRVGIPLVAIMVILLSVAHIAPLYYKTYMDERAGFDESPKGTLNVPKGLPLTQFKQAYARYMLLAQGDRVSFDAGVMATNVRYSWLMELEVVDVTRGERWNFSSEYYAARAPTPEFIAPRDSLYKFIVRVTFKPLEGTARDHVTIDISMTVSGRPSTRLDVRDRLLLELLVIMATAIALLMVLGRRLQSINLYRGFIGLVLWEVKSFYLWLLAPVIAFMYTLFSLNVRPAIGGPSVVLAPVFVTNSPDILVPYTILVVVAVAIVLSYKIEGGYDKAVDILPRSRISMLAAKLIAVLLVTWAPLILCALNIYVVWLDEILLGSPTTAAAMLGYYALYTLTLTGVLMATPLFMGSLTPRFVPVILVGVMVPLLLTIDNPLKSSLGFDLRKAAVLAENPIIYLYRELPWSSQAMETVEVSRSYIWFTSRGLMVTLIALIVSLIAYLRRELT
ncbi:MAG: hypothetical protein RRE21_00140 [Desulfurococcales archaeon]|nr:hypothetical protein [Desulfurococcales archaeon]